GSDREHNDVSAFHFINAMRRILFIFALFSFSLPFFAQNSARMLSGVNNVSVASYTFVAKDSTRLSSFSSASAKAATLASGLTIGFQAGTEFSVQNVGAGSLTITCTSC